MAWLPDDFEHPTRVDLPTGHHLRPIHEDDTIAQIPAMLGAARVPATIVNWAGSELVSIEEWCAWLSELTGLEPTFRDDERAIASLPLDTTRMHELVGPARVHWKEGLRRMVQARNPELLRG